MRAITTALLADHLPRKHKILEIGCGSGLLIHELAQRSSAALAIGTDRHPLALAHASREEYDKKIIFGQPASQFVQSDLHHLPFSDQTFDLVVALDVFDQAGVELKAALQESRRVLEDGGQMLLRVSAYPWLMSEHDQAFNTAQRFNRRPLTALVQAAGFRVLRTTHANTLLSPPVIGLRLLQRWQPFVRREALYTNSFTNWILAAALQSEARWLRHHNLRAGISLYLFARKES